MSVLIRDMEMPKDGAFVEVLIWSDGHVTQTGDSYFAEDGRAYYQPCDWKYFSAVPVQPHGRLIDADALIKDGWKLYKVVKRRGAYAIHEMSLDYPDIPTIITEEKE